MLKRPQYSRLKYLGALVIGLALLSPASGSARSAYHHRVATYGYGDAYYTNVSGHHVHRPMMAQGRPQGASARCRDGSWSFSEHHRGTCSHHGGVASWI